MGVKFSSLKNRWKSSLAAKQLTYILLFSSIITMIGAINQLYWEYLWIFRLLLHSGISAAIQ